MGVLDTIAEMGKSAITTDLQLKQLREELNKTGEKVDVLGRDLQDLKDRVTRLEAQREADRAGLAAEIERFKLLAERAELRLQKPLPPAE